MGALLLLASGYGELILCIARGGVLSLRTDIYPWLARNSYRIEKGTVLESLDTAGNKSTLVIQRITRKQEKAWQVQIECCNDQRE